MDRHLKVFAIVLLMISLATFSLSGCAQQSQTSSQPKAETPSQPKAEAPAVAKNDAAKEPYKIGAVLSITGAGGAYGGLEKDGAMMAVEEINAKGGINGHPLQLLIEDDKSESNVAVTLTDKLIYQDKVSGIVGSTFGNNTLAMISAVEKGKVPVIAPNGTIDVTKSKSPWVFRGFMSDLISIEATYQFVVETLKLKKVGLLHFTDAYGMAAADEIKRLAGERKTVELVAVEQFAPTDTDMTAQLTKIRSRNPEVLIVYGSGAPGATAVKNARDLGIKAPILATFGLQSKSALDIAGPASEGMIVQGIIDSKNPRPYQADFVKKIKEKFNRDASFFEAMTYDDVLLMAEALKKSGPDPKAVRDALETIKDFQGVTGMWAYSPTNHEGLGYNAMVMLQVKDKQFLSYEALNKK